MMEAVSGEKAKEAKEPETKKAEAGADSVTKNKPATETKKEETPAKKPETPAKKPETPAV